MCSCIVHVHNFPFGTYGHQWIQACFNQTPCVTREELTATDFFNYFTEPQKAREVYQKVFANGSVTDSPLTLRHKDGKLTDILHVLFEVL